MDLASQIGQKIRNCRIEKKMTVKDLAAQAQITASMLSQIEHGQATPSLNTIRLLSIALDRPIYRFFLNDPDIQHDIVRKTNRKQIIDQGIHYEILTPDMNGAIEMMQLTLPAGSASCQTPLGHKGEEVALIQEGAVELTLGTEICLLHAGDSVRIKNEIKHKWSNTSQQRVIILFAVTPPSF